MSAPATGFWGPPTSSVDWCEANYEHTRYVCELFNTLSSVAMLLAGGLGLWLHRKSLERRFHLAFVAVCLVGLGSMAFHATLRFELQLLDEIPMLYAALVMLFILLDGAPGRRFAGRLPALLLAYGALVTALSALSRGTLQFYCFQVSFASIEVFALCRVYLLYRRSGSPLVRRLYAMGMKSYALAVLLWLVDLKACAFVGGVLPRHGIPNPQLHAWWHVLVSTGLYALLLLMACDRLQALGRSPELRFAAGVVPYVRARRPRDA